MLIRLQILLEVARQLRLGLQEVLKQIIAYNLRCKNTQIEGQKR